MRTEPSADATASEPDEVLIAGTHRPAWPRRTRLAAGAVALTVAVGALVWHSQHEPASTSSPVAQPSRDRPSGRGSSTVAALPHYAQGATALADGDLLVYGAPPDVRSALGQAFPQATDVQVQTVFPSHRSAAHAGPTPAFTSRLINARARGFRIALLAVRSIDGRPTGSSSPLSLQVADTGPDSVYSSIQAHAGAYLVNLYVMGPSSMSLVALDHNRRLLGRMVGTS